MANTLPAPTPVTTTWQFDPSHGDIGFAVRHLMISTVRGRFGDFRGTVETDGVDLATARVQFTIDAASIDTREPKRDAHLRSADFFDADVFPTLTFTSRRVDSHGDHRYTVVGDLTIRDITREVALDVHAEGALRDPWGYERAGFSARGVISRSDFGLTWNQFLEAGGVAVGDQVKLNIEAEIVRPAAKAA